jgi:ABC-type cobalamin/Fe3+-siderophores transport system ATPase subunit
MSSVFDAIAELKGVRFSYNDEPFINGLSLSVGQANFVGLLGANGSGKSTILKLLSGTLRPSGGDVLLWGKRLRDYPQRDRAKLISYLPQSLDVGVPFTVEELSRMGLYPYDKPPELGLDDALDMVGLTDKRDELLSHLSGGERRRAYIAMTLLQGAGVVLMDEPLANLDIRYQLELIRLLRGLNERRDISIVMALHDINLALQFPRLVLIKEGRVLANGTPQDVLSEELLHEAFGIRIAVRGTGREAYISYGD